MKREISKSVVENATSEKGKSTPGPWHTPGLDDGNRVISAEIDGKRRTLAHVYGGDDYRLNVHTAATRDANARLIAAAPDLLAALKLADERLEELGQPETGVRRTMIRAAISKAEGRTA